MFGLFMAILWIVVACTLGIKGAKHSNSLRSKAHREGYTEYTDTNRRTRDVDDNAVSYRYIDTHGQQWKVYPHGEKSNVNETLEAKYRIGQEIIRERTEYAEKNKKKAEEGGWRFYRIRINSHLLDSGKQNIFPRDYKGYEIAGPDVFIDRENGHECILLDMGLGAFCIYDQTDDKMYDWYFKTQYDFKTKSYIEVQDHKWNIGDQNNFSYCYTRINDPGYKKTVINVKGKKRFCDVIYKYSAQPVFKFSQHDLDSMLNNTYKYHVEKEGK